MALMKSSEIPKDAVILNEMEATGYIWDLVYNWESLTDTWALRFGAVALGAVNSLSGLLINRHYRWRLKLGNYGYLSSTIPVVVMPGILTLLFHKQVVSTDILLMKTNSCPICLEVRSGVIQLALGLAYPMVLAPTSALMFANRYSTFRVPNITEGPKVMFNFLRTHTRPFTGTLVYIAAAQLLASGLVTYCEMKNNVTLRNRIMEIEKEAETQGVM